MTQEQFRNIGKILNERRQDRWLYPEWGIHIDRVVLKIHNSGYATRSLINKSRGHKNITQF